jgi:nicotinate phosphoribosyltransferase
MLGGKRVADLPSLNEARLHAAESLARLPDPLRRLEAGRVPVEISAGIPALVAEMNDRQ